MNETQQSEIRDALALDQLPLEEQQELLEELAELVAEGALLRAAERMPDDKKEQFAELLESDASEDEVSGFISEHVSNSEALVEETLTDIRNDILAATGASQD